MIVFLPIRLNFNQDAEETVLLNMFFMVDVNGIFSPRRPTTYSKFVLFSSMILIFDSCIKVAGLSSSIPLLRSVSTTSDVFDLAKIKHLPTNLL